MTEDRAITLLEVCARLAMSRRTFQRLDRAGLLRRWGLVELPRYAGGKRRFSKASVEKILQGKRLRAG